MNHIDLHEKTLHKQTQVKLGIGMFEVLLTNYTQIVGDIAHNRKINFSKISVLATCLYTAP